MSKLEISWPMVAIVIACLATAGYFASIGQLEALGAALVAALGFAVRVGAFGKGSAAVIPPTTEIDFAIPGPPRTPTLPIYDSESDTPTDPFEPARRG